MNELLNKAEKWLNELGITTVAKPMCIMMNRNDIAVVGTIGEVMKELRSAISMKLYHASTDDDWYYLESF